MKRIIPFFLLILLISFLFACDSKPVQNSAEHQTETGNEKTTTEEKTPSILDTYLSKFTTEEILESFNEVVLDSEYYSGAGNYKAVQKWTEPIYYQINGNATEEDRNVLISFFAKLNLIEGFPGIFAADEAVPPNLSISFYNEKDFIHNMGEIIHFEEADGAVEYWYYDDTNEIYTARIGYLTGIDQKTRNSVLLEEMTNCLGLTDTEYREDSIVYSYSNTNLELTDMDWLILRLLYHPDMKCGMTEKECAEVIKNLKNVQ